MRSFQPLPVAEVFSVLNVIGEEEFDQVSDPVMMATFTTGNNLKDPDDR